MLDDGTPRNSGHLGLFVSIYLPSCTNLQDDSINARGPRGGTMMHVEHPFR